MTPTKVQELRELVESELKDVATVKKRVEDATRTWSPGRLLDERIPEEIARFNTHATSLQRILDKIDEDPVDDPKMINTVRYHCVTCGEKFNGFSDEPKAYSQGCPNCGSGNIYTVAPEERESETEVAIAVNKRFVVTLEDNKGEKVEVRVGAPTGAIAKQSAMYLDPEDDKWYKPSDKDMKVIRVEEEDAESQKEATQ